MIKPKLSLEQVRELRQVFRMADRLRREAGKKRLRAGLIDELAAKYGVARRTIQHIQAGTRWRKTR